MGKIIHNGVKYSGSSETASHIIYDNSTTGLDATNVQEAIDEKQDVLISGTNIKTINNNSILGNGDLTVSGLPSVSASDNGKVLMVFNGAWSIKELPIYDGTVN